jgi:hypothetical protein
MDALGMEKASLIGISMGGAISLDFSLRPPHRGGKFGHLKRREVVRSRERDYNNKDCLTLRRGRR